MQGRRTATPPSSAKDHPPVSSPASHRGDPGAQRAAQGRPVAGPVGSYESLVGLTHPGTHASAVQTHWPGVPVRDRVQRAGRQSCACTSNSRRRCRCRPGPGRATDPDVAAAAGASGAEQRGDPHGRHDRGRPTPSPGPAPPRGGAKPGCSSGASGNVDPARVLLGGLRSASAPLVPRFGPGRGARPGRAVPSARPAERVIPSRPSPASPRAVLGTARARVQSGWTGGRELRPLVRGEPAARGWRRAGSPPAR